VHVNLPAVSRNLRRPVEFPLEPIDQLPCFQYELTNQRYRDMDKDRIAGGVKKVTGKIKEQAGKALGDTQMETEGKADQAEGRVQGAVGHVKDAVREIAGKK
jgi:uncharacterized protein YjbJ (UPF0337 family)